MYYVSENAYLVGHKWKMTLCNVEQQVPNYHFFFRHIENINMTVFNLIQKMKRHAVFVVIRTNSSNSRDELLENGKVNGTNNRWLCMGSIAVHSDDAHKIHIICEGTGVCEQRRPCQTVPLLPARTQFHCLH